MGTINTTTVCGPDGQTIVTVHATNGYLTVYIDGIQGSTLVTGPGTHTVQWFGYPTSNGVRQPGPDVLWDTKLVTVPARTDCAVAPTTTQGQPTTSEAPSTTAFAPPSTINPCIGQDFDQPTGTWACFPTTIAPPSIGLASTTIATSGSTLPLTGRDGVPIEAGLASAFLVLGVLAVWFTRRRPVTS